MKTIIKNHHNGLINKLISNKGKFGKEVREERWTVFFWKWNVLG